MAAAARGGAEDAGAGYAGAAETQEIVPYNGDPRYNTETQG